MADKMFINLNGQIIPATEATASQVDSFRLRYGLYETYLLTDGMVEFEDLHWKRLFAGLKVLGFHIPADFTEAALSRQLLATGRANGLCKLCRLRLQVFTDDTRSPMAMQYLIESFPIEPAMTQWLSKGVKVAILPDYRKIIGESANFKISHNLHFLPTRKALESGVADDMLLLNEKGNVIESSIANIFLYREGMYFTPPLSEGCLAGTIRQVILNGLKQHNIPVKEAPIRTDDLHQADEIFLCNGIRKIRWVREFEGKFYGYAHTFGLYRLLFAPNK